MGLLSVLIMFGVSFLILPVVALFYWVPPLIMRNTDDLFVRRHATQVLNCMLTGLIGLVVGVTGIVLLYAGGAPLGILLILAAFAHGVASGVCVIMGAVKANHGETYEMPRWWVAFPFLASDS